MSRRPKPPGNYSAERVGEHAASLGIANVREDGGLTTEAGDDGTRVGDAAGTELSRGLRALGEELERAGGLVGLGCHDV